MRRPTYGRRTTGAGRSAQAKPGREQATREALKKQPPSAQFGNAPVTGTRPRWQRTNEGNQSED